VTLHVVAARHRRKPAGVEDRICAWRRQPGAARHRPHPGALRLVRDPRSAIALRRLLAARHAAVGGGGALRVGNRRRGGRFRAGRAWASFAAVATLSASLAVVHALNPRPKSGVPARRRTLLQPVAGAHSGRAAPPVARLDDERVLQDVPRLMRTKGGSTARTVSSSFKQPVLPREREGKRARSCSSATATCAAAAGAPAVTIRLPLLKRHVRHRIARGTDRADRQAGHHPAPCATASRRSTARKATATT